jgi:hypothetical protein
MPLTAALSFTATKLEPAYAPDTAITDALPIASGTYVAGQLLGQLTTGGKFAAYASGNSNGTQVARVIAQYDMVSNGTNVSLGTALLAGETETSGPVYLAGYFKTEELTGLDSVALASLGRLVLGATTSGILRVE